MTGPESPWANEHVYLCRERERPPLPLPAPQCCHFPLLGQHLPLVHPQVLLSTLSLLSKGKVKGAGKRELALSGGRSLEGWEVGEQLLCSLGDALCSVDNSPNFLPSKMLR